MLFGADGHDRGCPATSQANVNAGAQELFLDDVLADAVAVLAAVFLGVAVAKPAALADLVKDSLQQGAALARMALLGGAFGRLLGLVHFGVDLRGHVDPDKFENILAQVLLFFSKTEIHKILRSCSGHMILNALRQEARQHRRIIVRKCC